MKKNNAPVLEKTDDPDAWDEFDILDHIETAERALDFLEGGDETNTPDFVDSKWEDVRQAAARHDFAITTAHLDAYAAARAFAEAIAYATVPAEKLNRVSSDTFFEAEDATRAATRAAAAARAAPPHQREAAKTAAREAAAKAREAEKKHKTAYEAYCEAQDKARAAAKKQLKARTNTKKETVVA